jgi:hypothetical protein
MFVSDFVTHPGLYTCRTVPHSNSFFQRRARSPLLKCLTPCMPSPACCPDRRHPARVRPPPVVRTATCPWLPPVPAIVRPAHPRPAPTLPRCRLTAAVWPRGRRRHPRCWLSPDAARPCARVHTPSAPSASNPTPTPDPRRHRPSAPRRHRPLLRTPPPPSPSILGKFSGF